MHVQSVQKYCFVKYANSVSYTHLRAHETRSNLVCRLLLEKCVLTILELNWNQHLGHKKTKLNICHHTLALFKHLQNRSFHVVERTRTSTKSQKMNNARAKRAKILFCQICKFVGFLLPSTSWFLKLSFSIYDENTSN